MLIRRDKNSHEGTPLLGIYTKEVLQMEKVHVGSHSKQY